VTRPPEARLYLDADEIVVDSFAGGGGASKGIEIALGRGPDIAINHDAEAIALHAANHPESEHFNEDVWRVDPVAACRGRRVGLMWLSPDCKHFQQGEGREAGESSRARARLGGRAMGEGGPAADHRPRERRGVPDVGAARSRDGAARSLSPRSDVQAIRRPAPRARLRRRMARAACVRLRRANDPQAPLPHRAV
jgi:hypothetical protein